jgi:hypothetical protein
LEEPGSRPRKLLDQFELLHDKLRPPKPPARCTICGSGEDAGLLGAEPEITEDRRVEPSADFAWGPVPDATGRPALQWEKAWTDQQISVLRSGTPRHAIAVSDEADKDRVESMLRQLEYQAGLAAARGEQSLDTAWLRAELGLTTS